MLIFIERISYKKYNLNHILLSHRKPGPLVTRLLGVDQDTRYIWWHVVSGEGTIKMDNLRCWFLTSEILDMDLYNWFWSESVWVPEGFTWEDFTPKPGQLVPNSGDLWIYPFIFAGVLQLAKYLFLTPFLYKPLGRILSVRSKPYRHPPNNVVLDSVYRQYRSRPPHLVVVDSAKTLSWTERQVERWLRQKTVSQQATTLEKFTDCAWQLTYYSLFCVLGFVVLHDKPWLYDVRHCWYKFPRHTLDNEIWWYYMISLGFYWGQTITHFLQPQRHDSLQMLCHHLVTILLTSLSWVCNFVRIGSLILIVHECADIPLLTAKMFGYCGRRDLMDKIFVVFVLLWILTRLGIFPCIIIRSTLFEAHRQENMFYPVYYIFNGLILSIFLMHLMWTYNILQIIVRKFTTEHISDVRSSASEMSEDENSYPPVGIKKEN